jgi:hypothetical protein
MNGIHDMGGMEGFEPIHFWKSLCANQNSLKPAWEQSFHPFSKIALIL